GQKILAIEVSQPRRVSSQLRDGRFIHSSAATLASTPASSRAVPESGLLAYMTTANADVLQCGVCFLPLKRPIFQCAVGHAVCSPCRDKLKDSRKCHACGVAMPRGYHRCRVMERLVDSLVVPCPHAAHGCPVTPAYHGVEEHLRARTVPCRCPGEACRFTGPVAALVDHITRGHGWPCTATEALDRSRWFYLDLVDGFNFVVVADDAQAAGRHLILLNVARPSFGRVVSVVCIHPHGGGPSSEAVNCILQYCRKGGEMIRHYMESCEMRVACTDPSNGLPGPNQCYQFIVPKFVRGDDDGAVRCGVGHVLCSPCRDKLKDARECHERRGAMAGGYQRCLAMERVPPYGCGARPAYHAREEHLLRAAATCHCPGDACGFVGSTAALLDHAASAHGWHCGTVDPCWPIAILHDGFNLLVVSVGDKKYYLFLVNVVRHPFCRAVSVLCIRPRSVAAEEIRVEIRYWTWKLQSTMHHLRTDFIVACSDLSDALPDPNESYQLIVPKYVHGDDDPCLAVKFRICNAGPVVCSVCRDKLKATGKCHVCGITTAAYRRCHAMELLCPNAAYGCTVWPVYHDMEDHRWKCPHAPCCCPDKACDFVGSTGSLLHHSASMAGCAPMLCPVLISSLHEGFNFLRVAGDYASGPCLLFLLSLAHRELGCAISVLGIHPCATANGQGPFSNVSTECKLTYSRVPFVGLSNGMPSPDDHVEFVVPHFGLEENKETNAVKGRIFTTID
ncbi:LOW QUALITY PROTEIN: hypothetical protein U9M48_042000, partial [Paspalum notatum var. saurae]